jgi:hypothetical protein
LGIWAFGHLHLRKGDGVHGIYENDTQATAQNQCGPL